MIRSLSGSSSGSRSVSSLSHLIHALRPALAAMAVVLLGAAALSAQTTDTSNAEANRLFVEAVMLYRSAEGQDPDEAAAIYSQVRDRIDWIVAEYPATDQADLLRRGGVVSALGHGRSRPRCI